jgi:uncharacterized membrane protein
MPELLKLVHALAGAWLIAALIGRWVTLAQAARAPFIQGLRAILGVGSRFEWQVRVSSLVVLLLGIATAVAQGRPFLGPLQNAGFDWLFVSLILYLSIIPLVPLVFLPRGREFVAALEEASASGEVGERLRAAFDDRLVFAAHAYELGAILVVFALMITKPF